MSASSFHRLLALLDDERDGMWAVLDRAVELAEAERARLTLATISGPGRIVTCMCAFGALVCAPPLSEKQLQVEASRRLAHAAEFVPESISLTTVVLASEITRALPALVERDGYDLIVIGDGQLRRRRALRRVLRNLAIATLTVSAEPVAQARLLSRGAFRPRPATQT